MESLIHDKSSIVPLPRFDLFSVPPTQQTVEKFIRTEHKPISVLDSSSFVQFEIHTAFDEYLDLEMLFLLLEVKLKKIVGLEAYDGSAESSKNWSDVMHSKYLLHSVIKQLDIFIGDTQVSSSTPTYSYKAYIEALLGFSEDAKSSHLQSAYWDNQFPMTSDYKPLQMYGRLHSDLVFQDKVLLGGCKVTIRILFNEPKFYFISSKHKPEIELTGASLYSIRYRVPQYIVKAHDAALQISPAKYYLAASRIKPFTIMNGITDYNIDNLHSGQIPRRLFVMFVKNTSFNGDYTEDPFYFDHFSLNYIVIYVNGEQIPPKPFTPDFGSCHYLRCFLSVYEALDMLGPNSNMNISRADYKKGNTIIGFNLSQDNSNGPPAVGYAGPVRYGSVSLNVRFATPLTETITCLVYFEFDKILEIDINRNAKIDLY